MSLKRILWAAAGAVLLTVSFVLPASAATLTFYNDAATQTTARFTLECTGSCTAWDGVDFAGTDGDLFSLANNSEALELSTVNSITGQSFASLTKTDRGGASNIMFNSSAAFILIKIGSSPNVGIIQNLTEDNKFTFTQVGQGAGLSHTSEFGKTMTVIPLPAAGFLLLSAVGLLGFARRKA